MGKLTYSVRSKDVEIISYPISIIKFEGIVQYRIRDNSIGCSIISSTGYLSKFILIEV